MSAALRRGRAAPPVRIVHLGLGSFFRAHQAAYIAGSDDAEGWGIAAFSGRRTDLAAALSGQDGLYTLVTRGPTVDEFAVITSVSQALPGSDHDSWLTLLATEQVSIMTTTITEAGYLQAAGGGLDLTRPDVVRDIEVLRADPRAGVTTAPARIAAGLLARRAADAGPLSLVPCDNLPGNGRVLGAVLRDLLELVDPTAHTWFEESLSLVTTMVDRITPAATPGDAAVVLAGTGSTDDCPVVTEPFSEWVMSGEFPGGRPAWESAGVVMTPDIEPAERRKLWLLNGGHSLLAYVGLSRGHDTIAEAVADEQCRALLGQWWDLCARYLAEDVHGYRAALLARFGNPRISHSLRQIAADGSQKLPVRLLPILRWERQAGRVPEVVAVVLAAWIRALRTTEPPADVRFRELRETVTGPLREAVSATVAFLDAGLADDSAVIAAVVAAAG